MASPVAISSVLTGMANQLAVMLNTGGKEGRKAWENLHVMLADLATSIADTRITIEALLNKLEETGSLVLGYPDAQVLLRQMMEYVEEKVSAQSAADASQAIPLLKNLILLVASQLDMTPLCDSVHVEMIDRGAAFEQEKVDYMVSSSVDLSDPNTPYTVVSILGIQSSGKSFLLNRLFGTKFPVMDPRRERRQITRGILMSRCIDPSMLVLDIEGFDGRERGQDASFENQAALFALTVSDLLMVNISVFDIGRTHGGAQSLFNTIFQARTKLPVGLTNIVVVLRHCDGETTLEVLRQVVIDFLEEIWRSVNNESTSFTDYIEINIVGLTDKDSENFQKEAIALRKLLTNFTSSCKVPASSFSLSSRMLWDQIKQKKKLDLPRHKILLATLYCQKTVKACMEQFDDGLLKAEESPQGFTEVSNTLLASIITEYDRETQMYYVVVRDSERQMMEEKINKVFREHSWKLIRKIQEDISAQYKDDLARELKNMKKTDDVVSYDNHKMKSSVERFNSLCEDLKIFDLEYVHNCCRDLERQLNSYTIFHILSLKEEECARELIEGQKRHHKETQELMTILNQTTEEVKCLEEEIQQEREKYNKKEDLKHRYQTLESELQTQKERTKKFEEERLERAREATEELKKSEKIIEELNVTLHQMTEERLHQEREIEREQGKHNREKEKLKHRQHKLENELEIQKEHTRKFEEERLELSRKAIEEQKSSHQKIEELKTELNQRMEERQRLEKELEWEHGNNKRAKEEIEYIQQTLENDIEIQKESTKKIEEKCLEERAREAVEEQKRYDKNIQELMTKLNQGMEERQRLEEKLEWEHRNNKRAKEEMEHRQQTLENELEIQNKRTRKLEEAQTQASTSINLPIHFCLKWLLCPDYKSLQGSMEDPPITASLGPIDRLIQRLQLLELSRHALPVELSVDQIKGLREHFQEFRKNLLDSSLASKWWMTEVRELCYDTEDYLEEVTMPSGCWRLGNLGGIACIFFQCFFHHPQLSQFMDRAIGLEQMFPECLDEESEAAISADQGQETDPYLHIEQNAHIETLPSELVNQLAFDDDEQTPLKVVAISGCVGAGKIALASTVYLKYKRRFQCRAFVRVSRNPDFRSLLTSILSQIKAPPTHGFPDVQSLIASINKHLQWKRYLIVVNDVRETSVWDIISCAFPIDNCGSKIIITTESEHVAVACSGYEFETSTFKIDALSSCPDTTTEEKNEVLNLAYNNLPLHLKTCLLYLSMYPEGCTITKNDLVKQWIAEGFIPALQSIGRDEILEVTQNKTEEIAGGYFDELVTRGMIQPVERNHEGQVLSCTVQHMVLDLIKYKSKEENFIVALDNLESTVGHPDIVRRLSIQFGCEKRASILGSIMSSQVRSLAFFGFLKSVPSIGIYGLLRVLIISIWADEDKIFDLTRIGKLYHLRYLKIKCNTTVRLPLKIRRIQHLGTLELHAEVVAIPSDISHLEKLMHVLCPSKVNILDIGGLINLLDLQLNWSTLENLEENMNCLRSILEKLSNLRCLSLVSASGLYNVNALRDEAVVSRISISCDSLSIVSPAPAHLLRVELSRRCCIFSRLPKWLGQLTQLRVLKIALEKLLKEDYDILKAIPSLTVISLHVNKMSTERVVFGKGGFFVLTYFKFTCTVPWLKFEADSMPNLQKLRLGFIATTVDEQRGTTPIIIEHLSSGLKEISAKICCARGVDASSALLKCISNDASNPGVQLMGLTYYGDECRGIHCRYGETIQ